MCALSFGTPEIHLFAVQLPSIEHEFDHARIEKVMVGPRREVTLFIRQLPWNGHKGEYAEAIPLRFGGIQNFEEASAFFDSDQYEQSELAWVRYADGHHSKPGHLFIELSFERADARFIVECGSMRVGNN